MTEILTESFCERCGTRYTFESNARRRGFQRVRLLSLGFKHFVENDGLTVKEAMEAARGDIASSASSEQIDAFHRTFSFCMGCRQYTCANCWNTAEGMCLTCTPDLSREVLPAPFPDLPIHPIVAGPTVAAEGRPVETVPAAETVPPAEAWPSATTEPTTTVPAAPTGLPEPAEAATTTVPAAPTGLPEPAEVATTVPAATVDQAAPAPTALPAVATPGSAGLEKSGAEPPELPAAATAALPAATMEQLETPSAEPKVRPGAETDQQTSRPEALTPEELALVAGALAARSAAARSTAEPTAAEPTATPVESRDRAAVGRAQTRTLLGRFRPARPTPPPLPEPASPPRAAASPTAEPAAPPPPAGTVERQPTPALLSGPAAAPRDDIVAQPTWSIVAPDTASAAGAGALPGPMAAAPATSPQSTERPRPLSPPPGRPMPARPASTRPPAGTVSPWAARLASARPETGLWAESSRDVLGQPGSAAPAGIQACVSCGLPLSATARFCRRCGYRQG